jgi:hypothetical protein
MTDRERLLDEIARVFARSAVDAFLAQQPREGTPETAKPAEPPRAAGLNSTTNMDTDHAQHIRLSIPPAT